MDNISLVMEIGGGSKLVLFISMHSEGSQILIKKQKDSGAFGASSLCLPVVVAWANLLVGIGPRGNTPALETTLLTEEHAWLLICSLRAPKLTSTRALCKIPSKKL